MELHRCHSFAVVESQISLDRASRRGRTVHSVSVPSSCRRHTEHDP
ncbi:hypothetical protein FM106_27965 [Brachybacterium faecium]|nr:hypothetical protein FM106_27965 [Brachybacterium faecium]